MTAPRTQRAADLAAVEAQWDAMSDARDASRAEARRVGAVVKDALWALGMPQETADAAALSLMEFAAQESASKGADATAAWRRLAATMLRAADASPRSRPILGGVYARRSDDERCCVARVDGSRVTCVTAAGPRVERVAEFMANFARIEPNEAAP